MLKQGNMCGCEATLFNTQAAKKAKAIKGLIQGSATAKQAEPRQARFATFNGDIVA